MELGYIVSFFFRLGRRVRGRGYRIWVLLRIRFGYLVSVIEIAKGLREVGFIVSE